MRRHATPTRAAIRRRAQLASLLLFVVLAAACGSTVQIGADGQPVDAGQGNGLALAEGGQPGAAAGNQTATGLSPTTGTGGGAGTGGTVAPGTTGTGAPGAAPGSGAATPGGQTPATQTPGDGGTQPPSSGTPSSPRSGQVGGGQTAPGVTPSTITVGITVNEDSGGANDELLGASGISQGNQRRYWEIMRDQINREGGIAGREVALSVYSYSTAQGANVNDLEEGACEHWARDDRAFVASSFSNSDHMLECLANNGIASSGSSLMTQDDAALAPYRTHFIPSGMSLTAQMVNMTKGLVDQKFFDRGYKLGVVTYEADPFLRAVEGTLRSSLRRYGIEIGTDVQRIKQMESTNDLGEITAQVQSAVLKFKTEEVTHVLIVEEDAVLTLLFARSAENQDYRPRYGLNSQNGLTAIAGNIPEAQFNRAVGIGFIPTLDVPAAELPNTPSGERCLAMFKREGEVPGDANVRSIMLAICEDMRFFKAAIERGLPDITPESFAAGAEALGTSFPSFFGMNNALLRAGHHAGVASYRHARYEAACKCFHYTSKLIAGR